MHTVSKDPDMGHKWDCLGLYKAKEASILEHSTGASPNEVLSCDWMCKPGGLISYFKDKEDGNPLCWIHV